MSLPAQNQIGCRSFSAPAVDAFAVREVSSRRGGCGWLWQAQRPALQLAELLDGMVWCYLRPVRGCTSGGCDRAGGATICLGLLTFVLDLANSSRMVWGRSGSNLTPCCKKNWCETLVRVLHSLDRGGKRETSRVKSWSSEAN